MTAQAIVNPLPTFIGLNGLPLTGGYVYFGVTDQDPRTAPVSVYFDEALTIAASQPLRTTAGYLSRNGAPAGVYVDDNCSILVLDANSRQVYYAAKFNDGLRAALAASTGSTLVGHGAVTVKAKLDTIDTSISALNTKTPTAEDYGAVGDGVNDDATPLLNAANAAVAAGRTLALDGTKTYAISSLALPAGLYLDTNGATFQAHATTTSNSPLVTVAANVRVFGTLKIVVPTAMRRDRALTVSGADCVFDDIDVSSVDQQANSTDADDAAVRFVSANNVRFGRLRVDKFDQAVQFKTTSNPAGERFDITSYTRGVYVDDATVLRMSDGGWIRTASPNATYTPGHVGMLVSATTDDASRDIYIPGLLIEDAGEHGVRIGGPARVSEVALPGLHTKNTGGCGIKILGTDSGTPTSRNRNISFHDAIFEDCGTGSYTSNMCGVLAMYCDGVYADNVVVRKNSKLYSAHTGVRVAACGDVRITGDFSSAQFDGTWLDGSLGDIDRVHIGGISRSNGRDGYRMAAGTSTIRRITTDLNCDSNTALGFNIAVGAGTMVDSLFKFKTYNNTSGAGACDNAAAALDGYGAEGSTPLSGITATNGSRWSNGTTLNILKAGAWVAL